ncbi:MAG: MlaE family ABC transporter permease, partial [Saprospiraceae bacterium]
VAISASVSIMGGYVSSVPTGMITHSDYILGLRSFFVPYNVTMMFVKAFVFAFILTSISCYQGYFVKGGSIELGKSSTSAVVYSYVVILIADLCLAIILT